MDLELSPHWKLTALFQKNLKYAASCIKVQQRSASALGSSLEELLEFAHLFIVFSSNKRTQIKMNILCPRSA